MLYLRYFIHLLIAPFRFSHISISILYPSNLSTATSLSDQSAQVFFSTKNTVLGSVPPTLLHLFTFSPPYPTVQHQQGSWVFKPCSSRNWQDESRYSFSPAWATYCCSTSHFVQPLPPWSSITAAAMVLQITSCSLPSRLPGTCPSPSVLSGWARPYR